MNYNWTLTRHGGVSISGISSIRCERWDTVGVVRWEKKNQETEVTMPSSDDRQSALVTGPQLMGCVTSTYQNPAQQRKAMDQNTTTTLTNSNRSHHVIFYSPVMNWWSTLRVNPNTLPVSSGINSAAYDPCTGFHGEADVNKTEIDLLL